MNPAESTAQAIPEKVQHFTTEQCSRCGEASEHLCPRCHKWIENVYIPIINNLQKENQKLRKDAEVMWEALEYIQRGNCGCVQSDADVIDQVDNYPPKA